MKQTALITGASSGIGLALAREFAKHQINVLLVARNESALTNLANELTSQYGIKAQVLVFDLASLLSVQKVFEYCVDNNIIVDYLVNNAGFGDFGLFAESNWEKQLQMIQVNINALTYLTRLFLPEMIKRKKGRILNVASTAAFQPGPLMAVYYATKSFVLHFSEAIANELELEGITVTALCPGATESKFQSVACMDDSRLFKNKKLPTSEEVAVYGFKSMMKGKRVAVHGFRNYLMAISTRFAPRNMVVKTVRFIQDKVNIVV